MVFFKLEKFSYGNNFYLAKHPHASEKILISISKYHSEYDLILLQHPNLPPIALENVLNRQSKSFYVGDRKFVARYPQTPISLLKVLAQDKDFGVREAAQFRLERYHIEL